MQAEGKVSAETDIATHLWVMRDDWEGLLLYEYIIIIIYIILRNPG